ncbi:glycosyltransferase family 4 protein [Bradyrhizobium sp. 187]|uniref:glycosyltransferase family 4 protein n=1 Tax=Bradyrhizobium sp. 187 TaxID=2782655 RepID=UPI001FFE69B1|nr:glycosyltransferase family 4 protein [Bradyrhizobium sp. 187]UPJ74485.1 glycosyltransferase family 4 protein [Bradyrhizobium sp. 187]
MTAQHDAQTRPLVIAVGQIPPPMTGYAYITGRMIATIRENADVEAINMSPADRKGLRKHFYKGAQTILACRQISRNSRQPKTVYLGCEGDWGLVYTAVLVVASRVFDHAILLHHHSFSYVDRNSRLMRFILSVGGKHIRHLFLCKKMHERLEARYGKVSDFEIISNAAFVKPCPNTKERHFANGPLRIGLLSNLTPEKGLHTFIDLIRLLRKNDLAVEGVLAGPIQNIKDAAIVRAAEVELNGALQYIGPVYGLEKNGFYEDLDLFVFPTQYANEAQPTVLFEALAAGIRIIAFDRGCIADQIRSNGLAIPPEEDFCARALDYVRSITQKHANGPSERKTVSRSFEQLHSSASRIARSITAPTVQKNEIT